MRIRTKQKKLLFIGLFAINFLYAQVGINTNNPKGVLHINAGTLGATTDDIVISDKGRVGIGTISPATKLDIISATPGAIRIADGSEGAGKVLGLGTIPGVASWQNKQGAWSASLLGGNLPYTAALGFRSIKFNLSEISQNGVGEVNASAGTIKVPYDGMYRISISGYSSINRFSGYYIAGYFFLRNNGTGIWGPHSLGQTDLSVMTYVSYIRLADLKAADILDVLAVEISPGYANGVSDLILQVEFVQ
jgi:hypothetical protein